MKEKEFMNWMVNSDGLSNPTAMSRLSNCRRVCEFEGNLDEHYEKDGCRGLLLRLDYTKLDEQACLPARHSIPIDGNIYNGTATFRQAVRKYIAFRDSQK